MTLDENNNSDLTEESGVSSNAKKSKMPLLALSFNAFAVAFFGLGMLFMLNYAFFFFGLLCMLASVSSPFIAVALGICSLCLGKKKIGTDGIVYSVLAIAIPIIFVTVMIILFSTGVAYIRWM